MQTLSAMHPQVVCGDHLKVRCAELVHAAQMTVIRLNHINDCGETLEQRQWHLLRHYGIIPALHPPTRLSLQQQCLHKAFLNPLEFRCYLCIGRLASCYGLSMCHLHMPSADARQQTGGLPRHTCVMHGLLASGV